MRSIPYKSSRQNRNAHFVFGNFFFSSKISPFMGLCWKMW